MAGLALRCAADSQTLPEHMEELPLARHFRDYHLIDISRHHRLKDNNEELIAPKESEIVRDL